MTHSFWTQEDIDLLFDMYMQNMSISRMGRVLSRSKEAVRKAIRNIKLKHTLHYSMDHVAHVHGCKESDLCALVPHKYNVDIDHDQEEEDNYESEESTRSIQSTHSTHSTQSITTTNTGSGMMQSILFLFVMLCLLKIYVLLTIYPMVTIAI
jgi:hypothetical protein